MAVEEIIKDEEVIKDQFSDEEYMVGDDTYTAFVDENEDPMKSVMNLDSRSVKYAQQERLEGEAFEALPVLKKENDALKFELGNALKTIEAKKTNTDISPSVFSNIDIKTGSLSEFTKSVGSSFMNVAKAVPDKIDAIFKDPEKRKNMIRGLNIINESSGIKPISQAKSPLGSVASGLLKAEAQFTAEDIARLKAQKKEPRRYPSMFENSLKSKFENWEKKTAADKDSFEAVFQKYNLAKKVALDKKELPTGIFNSVLSPLKKFAEEAGFSDEFLALQKKFADNPEAVMDLDDQNTFNDLFQAATFQQVVQEVKKLYPVSNKDIDTLLKTKGDISTRPEALRQLIAAQMAVREIVSGSEELAYKYYELNDPMFDTKSVKASENMIASRIKSDVTDETLQELFGTTKDVTDAGLITAYYYQKMKSDEIGLDQDPYKIFQTAEANKQKIIEEKKKKYKKSKDKTPPK